MQVTRYLKRFKVPCSPKKCKKKLSVEQAGHGIQIDKQHVTLSKKNSKNATNL